MGDVIPLFPIELDSALGLTFVTDCCRCAEGLVEDGEIRSKYGLSIEAWCNSTKDKALVEAVRSERERRVLTGVAAREAAARHFVKTPEILAKIMENQYSNPRHVIESAKEIRAIAVGGGNSPDGFAESTRFVIRIDLSADGKGEHVEDFDVPRAPMEPLSRDEHDGEE